jgi:hypothetical protein
MSFTRFHDDPCRIEKQLQEMTDQGKYIINKPGWGENPCFMDDPYMRMQQWGANLMTNSINLESELLGLYKPLTRDCYQYQNFNVQTQQQQFPSCRPFTDQTRATNPAWTARDLEQVNWYILPLDPQENVCLPFQNNLNTRLLERDYFIPTAPCPELRQ